MSLDGRTDKVSPSGGKPNGGAPSTGELLKQQALKISPQTSSAFIPDSNFKRYASPLDANIKDCIEYSLFAVAALKQGDKVLAKKQLQEALRLL